MIQAKCGTTVGALHIFKDSCIRIQQIYQKQRVDNIATIGIQREDDTLARIGLVSDQRHDDLKKDQENDDNLQ